MSLKDKSNHYNVKFLKGYGFSIKIKDSKIILKNCSDPFKEPGDQGIVCQQYVQICQLNKHKRTRNLIVLLIIISQYTL